MSKHCRVFIFSLSSLLLLSSPIAFFGISFMDSVIYAFYIKVIKFIGYMFPSDVYVFKIYVSCYLIITWFTSNYFFHSFPHCCRIPLITINHVFIVFFLLYSDLFYYPISLFPVMQPTLLCVFIYRPSECFVSSRCCFLYFSSEPSLSVPSFRDFDLSLWSHHIQGCIMLSISLFASLFTLILLLYSSPSFNISRNRSTSNPL